MKHRHPQDYSASCRECSVTLNCEGGLFECMREELEAKCAWQAAIIERMKPWLVGHEEFPEFSKLLKDLESMYPNKKPGKDFSSPG